MVGGPVTVHEDVLQLLVVTYSNRKVVKLSHHYTHSQMAPRGSGTNFHSTLTCNECQHEEIDGADAVGHLILEVHGRNSRLSHSLRVEMSNKLSLRPTAITTKHRLRAEEKIASTLAGLPTPRRVGVLREARRGGGRWH